MFVFHCTHVRMSYVLNSYLLTYLGEKDGWDGKNTPAMGVAEGRNGPMGRVQWVQVHPHGEN